MSRHLDVAEKEAFGKRLHSALQSAFGPLLVEYYMNGICPHCVGRTLVAVLTERAGRFAGTLVGVDGADANDNIAAIAKIFVAAMEAEVARDKSEDTETLAAMLDKGGQRAH